MRADALGEPVVQRADLERGLHLLERVLVDLQLLVGAHDRGGADPRRWLSGAQDVDPVQQRLLVDLGLVALITERAVLDVEGEVLGHLALVDHAPGALADLPRARVAELAALPLDHLLDLLQVSLGQRQQLLAFAGSLGRDRRVAAHDQSLAGELRGRDLAQPLLVKQRELKARRDGQLLDLRSAQRGDEPDALLLEHLDPGVGDHPAVADEHQVLDPERVLDALDRGAERGRVPGVALVHLDRDRLALRRAAQPVADLRL